MTVGMKQNQQTPYTTVNTMVLGRLTKSVSSATTTVVLTSAECTNAMINFTGVLVQNIAVQFLYDTSPYILENNTTGAYTLTMKTAADTGFAVPRTEAVFARSGASTMVPLGWMGFATSEMVMNTGIFTTSNGGIYGHKSVISTVASVSYTIVSATAGKTIIMTAPSATVNAGNVPGDAPGFRCEFVRQGASATVFSASASATIETIGSSLAQYGRATLEAVSSTVWNLSGDVA